jgi:hypothetical protein
MMGFMAAPSASTKTSLGQRLTAHAKTHWPELVAYRSAFERTSSTATCSPLSPALPRVS